MCHSVCRLNRIWKFIRPAIGRILLDVCQHFVKALIRNINWKFWVNDVLWNYQRISTISFLCSPVSKVIFWSTLIWKSFKILKRLKNLAYSSFLIDDKFSENYSGWRVKTPLFSKHNIMKFINQALTTFTAFTSHSLYIVIIKWVFHQC